MLPNPLFQVPARVSSLMTRTRQDELNTYQARSVSSASRLSEISQTCIESTVSDFLSEKILQLENQSLYICSIKEGLDEANLANAIDDQEYRTHLNPLISKLRSTSSTLFVLKRQRNILEEDFTDTLALEKRPRVVGPPNEDLLERAYRDTILPRVMKASGKQKAQHFNAAQFKDEVKRYYGIENDISWCHILGMYLSPPLVKAAHIVPKSMSREELAHLFGDQDAVTTLPQNSLSLHHVVEGLLDSGDIAVIPIPGKMTTPTTWKCVVLDQSVKKLNNIVYTYVSEPENIKRHIRVKDLDERELKFLNDNRPRRRYLYFRFIVSYLWAKRQNSVVGHHVEAKKFWPSGGAYLQRSTLQSLARCVSGSEIPSHLISNQTFELPKDPGRDTQAGMILAADIRDLGERGYDNSSLMEAVTDIIMDHY
ncbi:hypothetical protein N7495_003626 [Penicillium taxi]|uniref:uncharacterized protein n=1 Tax=Penicillium taxi TaxID=168475 RepID=UPI002545A9EB|nr:uncharacterized protein N7495_003626 [Penicillium taxi]KAJ5898882.1 hypothetical protein N7495_003626 [Penicillium taxi]